jgi:hypothetical protein
MAFFTVISFRRNIKQIAAALIEAPYSKKLAYRIS